MSQPARRLSERQNRSMITYNTQGTAMPDIDQAKTTAWLRQVAKSYGKIAGDINYIFVDDHTMLDINRRFIGHDYYTDHIGFDYTNGNALSGDIYISLDTVRTNAELYSVSFSNELRRIIAHGLLHLCGLRDKTEQERTQMQQAEDQALAKMTGQLL